jgi:hypothetical protein
MTSEKQAAHLQKLREAKAEKAKYKGGSVQIPNTAYQEKDQVSEAAGRYESRNCSEPFCPDAWTVNATGIFYKCSRHAWIDRSRSIEPGPAWLDPFEGVPLFSEHGRKAWAHRLRYRDDRGDKLTDYQRWKYRAALGLG